ncbi:BrnA antitoxin family protein [Limnohabitans sp. Rim8]
MLAALKNGGRGWQTQVNETMREWVSQQPLKVQTSGSA